MGVVVYPLLGALLRARDMTIPGLKGDITQQYGPCACHNRGEDGERLSSDSGGGERMSELRAWRDAGLTARADQPLIVALVGDDGVRYVTSEEEADAFAANVAKRRSMPFI